MSTMDQKSAADVKSGAKARGRRLRSLRKMADLTRKDIQEKYHINAGTLAGLGRCAFWWLDRQGCESNYPRVAQ